jgi:hypothetical protein
MSHLIRTFFRCKDKQSSVAKTNNLPLSKEMFLQTQGQTQDCWEDEDDAEDDHDAEADNSSDF